MNDQIWALTHLNLWDQNRLLNLHCRPLKLHLPNEFAFLPSQLSPPLVSLPHQALLHLQDHLASAQRHDRLLVISQPLHAAGSPPTIHRTQDPRMHASGPSTNRTHISHNANQKHLQCRKIQMPHQRKNFMRERHHKITCRQQGNQVREKVEYSARSNSNQ